MLNPRCVELSLSKEANPPQLPVDAPATGTWLGLSLIPRQPLSPRERQILDLIRMGHSQKEVAYRLGVSDATVRVLYARAMRKLGRPKRPLGARRLTPQDRRALSAR